MRLAKERHHVMRAMREERNVLHKNEIVVTGDLLECPRQDVLRHLLVAAEELAIRLYHTRGCVAQSFSLRIFANPLQKGSYGVLRLTLRGAAFVFQIALLTA